MTSRRISAMIVVVALTGCSRATSVAPPVPASGRGAAPSAGTTIPIIPIPTSVQITAAESIVIDSTTTIVLESGATAEVEGVARFLVDLLATGPSTAPRRLAAGELPPAGSIQLKLDASNSVLGAEGYELTITRSGVTLAANQPNGLFYGVQTMRQLMPIAVEYSAARNRVLRLPVGRIVDIPRFAWRGAMLDVARHFLSANDVKRYMDAMALYKLNRLHLHLSDDQGWRIEIKSRPNLALHGGSTQVGGGAGGYFTQADYAGLIAHAQARFITVVPEIDMPGHTNAALASVPELNCDGVAPASYTGINVGFSSLCVDRDATYAFVTDVVREVAALTPTPYFHMGGDEVERLTHVQYLRFVERVQDIVRAQGKQMIGWGEIAPANLLPTTILQHWRADSARLHVARGGKVILSPGPRTYLDMKYDSSTVLGLRWAGLIDVKNAYDWEPATFRPDVPESALLGVEAPLWSETLVKREDYDFMAFPRLAAIAEVGWSAASAKDWEGFRLRLAAHGPRLAALGVNFYRSPQIPWAR